MDIKTDTVVNQTLDLESLISQYNTLLMKYEQTVQDYAKERNTQKVNLETIKGYSFSGTGSAGTSTATTLDSCVQSCKSNKKCTGATFNSGKCDIRMGDGSIVSASSSNSYAIVPRSKRLLNDIKTMNDQLININASIQSKISFRNYPNINHTKILDKNIKLVDDLRKKHNRLLDEQSAIDEILDEYENIDNITNDSVRKSTYHFYMYILLTILVVIILFILVQPSLPNSSNIMPMIKNVDQYVNENSYSIMIILISVPVVYYLMKLMFSQSNNKLANRYIK